MAKFDVIIENISSLHLGSGQADVNIDSDIIHDELGFPYFPARRFKGLLYESALEVTEMLTLADMSFETSVLEDIFHHVSSDRGKNSNIQLIVPNFYLQPFEDYQKMCSEWKYLQTNYGELFRPSDLVNIYTSIRYQTQLENGVAATGSLHNMRVLNAGLKFYGTLELINGNDEHIHLISLAVRNLSSAGLKRNRGFGNIACSMKCDNGMTDDELIGNAFGGM